MEMLDRYKGQKMEDGELGTSLLHYFTRFRTERACEGGRDLVLGG